MCALWIHIGSKKYSDIAGVLKCLTVEIKRRVMSRQGFLAILHNLKRCKTNKKQKCK